MTARGLRIVPDAESSLPVPAPTDRKTDPAPARPPRIATVRPSPPAAAPPPIPEQHGALGDGRADLAIPFGNVPGARWAPSAQDREWTARAVCALGDPDRLFVTGAAQREAAKLCRGCPVQMECLADALDNQIEFGVWGGLTERQRRALLKRRPDVLSWRAVLEQARATVVKPVAS
jgi:WhiB family redox-sensing transcriptional regulator